MLGSHVASHPRSCARAHEAVLGRPVPVAGSPCPYSYCDGLGDESTGCVRSAGERSDSVGALMQHTWNRVALAVLTAFASATPVAAQEVALKAVITLSKFEEGGTGTNPWVDRLTATGFGGHVRFRFGPLALQPE